MTFFLPLSESLPLGQVPLLGVDLGDRRMGLAVSDGLQKMAFPLPVQQRARQVSRDCQELARLCGERAIGAIVWGWPLHLSGDFGIQCQKVQAFAEACRGVMNLPFFAWDERLSTVASAKLLDDLSLSRSRQSTILDSQSAVFILQGMLDWLRIQRSTTSEG